MSSSLSSLTTSPYLLVAYLFRCQHFLLCPLRFYFLFLAMYYLLCFARSLAHMQMCDVHILRWCLFMLHWFPYVGALIVFFTLHCLLFFACLIHAYCVGGLISASPYCVGVSLFVRCFLIFITLCSLSPCPLFFPRSLPPCCLVICYCPSAFTRMAWPRHCLG